MSRVCQRALGEGAGVEGLGYRHPVPLLKPPALQQTAFRHALKYSKLRFDMVNYSKLSFDTLHFNNIQFVKTKHCITGRRLREQIGADTISPLTSVASQLFGPGSCPPGVTVRQRRYWGEN